MKIESTIQSPTKASHISVELGRQGGVTVDKELNAESKNPIANAAVVNAVESLTEGISQASQTATNNAEKIEDLKQSVEEQTAKLNEKIDNKLSAKGYYPQLSVGFADNLVGRGEPTAEEISFRVSADRQSIENDVARISAIKGSTLVLNQWIPHEVEEESTIEVEWHGENGEFSHYGNDEYTITNDGYSYEGYMTIKSPTYESVPEAGHKLLLLCEVYTESAYTIFADIFGTKTQIDLPYDYQWFNVGFFVNTPNSHSSQTISLSVDKSVAYMFSVKDRICLVDLTQMFGRGYEPVTLAEFEARRPMNVDLQNIYTPGRIVSMNVEALKTVGFNQWDGELESGTYDEFGGEPIESTDYLRNANMIRVFGDTEYYFGDDKRNLFYVYFYDKDQRFIIMDAVYSDNTIHTPSTARYMNFTTGYRGNICINISHTGISNGKYAPYTSSIIEFPIIKRYFPNGMRSIPGKTYDEISYNIYEKRWEAIRRVEERIWYSGDENDADVVTDGNTTLEACNEPFVIVLPTEDINFNYYVEDFGTEEAISNGPSAPFRADIIYMFNAVDTIRNNRLRIEALERAIAQLTNAVSAV